MSNISIAEAKLIKLESIHRCGEDIGSNIEGNNLWRVRISPREEGYDARIIFEYKEETHWQIVCNSALNPFYQLLTTDGGDISLEKDYSTLDMWVEDGELIIQVDETKYYKLPMLELVGEI